jgi:hypothetical protein
VTVASVSPGATVAMVGAPGAATATTGGDGGEAVPVPAALVPITWAW